MDIRLRRVNDAVHLIAENETGNSAHIDGAEAVGGTNAGFRPMQLLLASLAGCASMDLVSILKKKRQRLDDLEIRVSGKRAENTTPSPFTAIHLHFILTGSIEAKQAEQAITLSVEKYCSVGASLSRDIEISHSFEVHNG